SDGISLEPAPSLRYAACTGFPYGTPPTEPYGIAVGPYVDFGPTARKICHTKFKYYAMKLSRQPRSRPDLPGVQMPSRHETSVQGMDSGPPVPDEEPGGSRLMGRVAVASFIGTAIE